MSQTKRYKQIKLMFELGPLCEQDRDNIINGYDEKGVWKAWIRLVPMQLILAFHADWPHTEFYDFTHKQLDEFRALNWRPANPLGVLDLLVRQVFDR